MPDELIDQLESLRRHVRRMLWIYGVCCLVAMFLATVLVIGFLDWLIHFDDSGVRLLLGLGILGGTGYVGWRTLLRPLMTQLSDLALALKIEQQYPGFRDSLASTVEFVACQRDQRVGSPAMQAEVIRQTIQRLRQVSVDTVVDTRPVRHVAWGALATCLVVGVVIGMNQARAATAIQRLVYPFSTIPWPRSFDLRFVTRELEPLAAAEIGALTVVQGETLEVYVENVHGPLPDDLTFEALGPDGKNATERMRQTAVWDAAGQSRSIGVSSLVIARGPMFIRATGGDGETPAIQVDVVPPPHVDSLHLKVIPPAYTGQPENTLPENVGHIEGYVGTRVELRGSSNKTLESVTLHRRDGNSVLMDVDPEGRRFHGSFKLEKPGSATWWLTLRDRQGFENPEAQRYDLRTIPDLVPDVRIDVPATDLLVTPTAKVAFKVAVKDDLGIKQVRLVLAQPTSAEQQPTGAQQPSENDSPDPRSNRSTGSAEHAGNSASPVASTQNISAMELFEGSDRPQQLTVDHALELEPLQLSVGARLTVTAEAVDYFDLGLEHVGRSSPRVLTVVSPEEKRSELADRQADLLLELERVHKLQSAAHGHVKELQLQIENAGHLRAEDLDLLKRVELDQRQITARLGTRNDGLEGQARSIQEERQANNVNDPQAEQLMQTLADEIEFLRREALPQIEQDVTKALKVNSGEQKNAAEKDRQEVSRQSLNDTAQKQEQILSTLGKVLDQLSKWRQEHNLAADLRELATDQQALSEETRQVGQKTIGKSLPELGPQQTAELAKLAERQRRLASEVENFQGRLAERPPQADGDPDNQDRILDEVQRRLDESRAAVEMREAASQLSRNDIGQAVQRQEELAETLRKLQDVLEEREITDQETLVKQLSAAQQELAGLRRDQQDVMQKLSGASQIANEGEREQAIEQLRKEEAQLRQKLEETLRRLQRLQSNAARRSAARASQRMQDAEEELAANRIDPAQEQFQEALDDLEQAERDLARDKQTAELQLAQELMERIADELKALHDQQQALIDEAARIDGLQSEAGKWSRSLLKSARSLAQTQANVRDETRNTASEVKVVRVLELALEGAARFMEQAQQRLERDPPDVSDGTRHAQGQAKQRIADLLAALEEKPDDQQSEKPQGEPEGQGGQQNSGPPGESIPIVAQLKVVRAIQEDLIDRVDAIQSAVPEGGQLSAEQQTDLDRIASEQTELADLVRELTSYFGDPVIQDAAVDEPVKQDSPSPASSHRGQGGQRDRSDRGGPFDAFGFGQEPSSGGANQGDGADKSDGTKKAEKPAPSKARGKKSLDDDLLQQLAPELPKGDQPADSQSPSADAPDELERAVQAMRTVGEKLGRKELSDDIRRQQHAILDDIDALIEKLKQPPRQQSQDQSSDNQKNQQSDQQQRNQQGSKSQQRPQGGEPQRQPSEGTGTGTARQPTQAEKSAESTDRELNRQIEQRTAELARRRALINEVWGHLPPSVRERLLNVGSEKLLPNYEELIRKYYEVLAESAPEAADRQ